jgi:SAM-dependent methyltransferase
MLDVAAGKFSDGEAVTFVPADAMALPFDDGSFDLLVCQFGVMFFPDIVASYKEAARVLRRGGDYMFSTWGSQAENPFAQVAHDAIAEFFPDNPPGFYRVPFFYHDPDLVRGDLRAAGLTDVDHAEVRHERVVTDLSGFARGLVFGNPVLEEIRGRGGDADAVMQRVLLRLVERFGEEPATMPLKITVFTVCVA